jgi:hypothetical protein
MSKKEKLFLTPKWLKIKQMFENGTNGSNEYGSNFPIDGELDILTQHFLGMISVITLKEGYDAVIEGVKMDLWKERIWAVVENAGLLPEIAWKEELENVDSRDTWYSNSSIEEFEIDLDKREAEAYKTNGY